MQFEGACQELRKYLEGLGPSDAVVLEASNGSIWWADQIEAKGRLAAGIVLAGEPPKSEVELLISIKGVTALIALAFLADVADIRRFRTVRKMNAYLRLVPRAKNSGGKERAGHITRESRKLTRTILTQSVHHVAASSVSLDRYYQELREKRGTGRARAAVIRTLCGMMRRMLLNGEQYRSMGRGCTRRSSGSTRECSRG